MTPDTAITQMIQALAKSASTSMVPFNWSFTSSDGLQVVTFQFSTKMPPIVTHTVTKKFLGFTVGTMAVSVTKSEVTPSLWYQFMDMLSDTSTRLAG